MAMLRFRAKSNMTIAEAERRHAAALGATVAPTGVLPPSMIADRLNASSGVQPVHPWPKPEGHRDHADFVRALNGAEHQDEILEERSGTAREAPSTGMRDDALGEPGIVGVQPAAPLQKAGDDDDGHGDRHVAGRLPRIIRDGTPVDTWIKTDWGLKRWRPIVDRIDIEDLPNGGRALVAFGRTQELPAELAAHLAWLLMPEEWRTHLRGELASATGEARR